MGQGRSVGAGLRGSGRRSRQPVSDARYDSGSRSPAGGERKRGVQNQALGRSRGGSTTKIHIAGRRQGRPMRFILHRRARLRRHASSAGSARTAWRPMGRDRRSTPMTANAVREPIAEMRRASRHSLNPKPQAVAIPHDRSATSWESHRAASTTSNTARADRTSSVWMRWSIWLRRVVWTSGRKSVAGLRPGPTPPARRARRDAG